MAGGPTETPPSENEWMEDREVFARESVTNEKGQTVQKLYIPENVKKRWSKKNPRKFTPDTALKIVLTMRMGAYVETVASMVGVARQTLYNWLKLTKDAENFEGEIISDTEELRAFRREFAKAIAMAESDATSGILRAGYGGTWQALAWFLERRFPERWRQRTSVINENPDGTPASPPEVTVHFTDSEPSDVVPPAGETEEPEPKKPKKS